LLLIWSSTGREVTKISDTDTFTGYSPEVQAERERIGKVQCQLVGQDGNAFAIMGRVQRAMRKAGYSHQATTEYGEASMSGDYNHLLRVAMDWTEDPHEDDEDWDE
jgi:hypothetical protein